MNERYQKFLDDIYMHMKKKGIKQKEILEYYKMSTSTLNNFLKGNTISIDTMDKVVAYIDDPKNWKK